MTWAELYFDLVFVFAVTQVTALLHDDHSWAGVGRALVLFVAVYWGWVGTSIHANTADVDTPNGRLGIFAVGLCSLLMALAVPEAYGERGLLFGIGYMLLRIVLAAVVFRGPRMSLNAFSVGLLVTGPLLVLGAFFDGNVRTAIWALAALVDLAVPAVVRRRLVGVHFDPSHLPERFGLFVIIALGESIVAIGVPAAGAEDLTGWQVTAVCTAFVLACSLWWVYFAFAAAAVAHALEQAEVQTDIVRRIFSYGHLAFVAGIIAFAVGMGEVVAHPEDRLDVAVAALLFGGCALYLLTFVYTRWMMFRQWSVTRLTAAAAVAVLFPGGLLIPGLAALALLVVVTVVLNLEEHRQVMARSKA